MNRGSILLSLIFILVISSIGLSLLGFVIFQQKIIRSRARKVMVTDMLHGALDVFLHHFKKRVFSPDLARSVNPEVDFFTRRNFPPLHDEHFSLTPSFRWREILRGRYRELRIQADVGVTDTDGIYRLESDIVACLLSGDVPLTMVPFWLSTDIQADDGPAASARAAPVPGVDHGSQEFSPSMMDTTSLVLNSLRIQGRDLDWLAVRGTYGQPAVDEPLPDGVYLQQVEGIIESIWVQGDISRLNFSIEADHQVIWFTHKRDEYRMEVTPGAGFVWRANDLETCYSGFAQCLLVNGNILRMSQTGPCGFLENIRLLLIVSGRVMIVSRLTGRRIDIRRMQTTGLTLVCGQSGVLSRGVPEIEVVDNPGEEILIEASLLVKGVFRNSAEHLTIRGSLVCREIFGADGLTRDFMAPGRTLENTFYLPQITCVRSFIIQRIEERGYE